MTRTAALLQCPGDPFILAYWLRNYDRVWPGEVDELQVLVNGCRHPEALAFCAREVQERGGFFESRPARMIHGEAIRALVERTTAKYLVLLEDDAFVRRSGAIRFALEAIAAFDIDVIGTPRGGMDPDIEAYAATIWPRLVSAESGPRPSEGPGLWPCFLFARRADLMRTSRRFESWTWQPGDTIPGLGYKVVGRPQTTDTCTAVAFELRGPPDLGGLGLRITPSVQYKELWHRELPPPTPTNAVWFHAGGLSNGHFLCDRWDGGGARPNIGGSLEGKDWAHRIWWWTRCWESSPSVLPHLRAGYRERLDRLTDFLGVRRDVEEWGETQPPWITWEDAE